MFTTDTFSYFDEACEHKFTQGWFEDNKERYHKVLKDPFIDVVDTLSLVFDEDVNISANKISRPVRPKNRHLDKGIVKDFCSIIIAREKKNRFELPPCIHLQLGSLDKDNFIKVGMYITNSAQTKKFQKHIDSSLDALIKEISKKCGQLQGEMFKRKPQILNPDLEYLYWYKSFYFCYYFSREEVISKNFKQNVIDFVHSSMPFYKYLNSIL